MAMAVTVWPLSIRDFLSQVPSSVGVPAYHARMVSSGQAREDWGESPIVSVELGIQGVLTSEHATYWE